MNNISPPYSRERKRRTMREERGKEGETMAIITVADTHSLSLPRTFPAKRKTKRKEGGLERRREEGRREGCWPQTQNGIGDTSLTLALMQISLLYSSLSLLSFLSRKTPSLPPSPLSRLAKDLGGQVRDGRKRVRGQARGLGRVRYNP